MVAVAVDWESSSSDSGGSGGVAAADQEPSSVRRDQKENWMSEFSGIAP